MKQYSIDDSSYHTTILWLINDHSMEHQYYANTDILFQVTSNGYLEFADKDEYIASLMQYMDDTLYQIKMTCDSAHDLDDYINKSISGMKQVRPVALAPKLKPEIKQKLLPILLDEINNPIFTRAEVREINWIIDSFVGESFIPSTRIMVWLNQVSKKIDIPDNK